MKKSLLPLVAVAVVLALLVYVRNSRQPQLTILDQVQLTALTPENLTPADVGRIELYGGGDPDAKVVLVRDSASPTRWLVASRFDAPASATKMDEFLADVTKLRGEFRTSAADDDDLANYDLNDENALHVVAYGRDGDDPIFHVLVGKSPNFRSVFMRLAGDSRVYVENKNLKSQAGIFGDGAAPESAPWLDKEVVKIAREEVEAVTIETPNRRLVFEKQTPEPAQETEEESGEALLGLPAEPVWVLASGGPGAPFRQSGLDSMLSRLNNLLATDVVDPADKAAYGLEPPMFTAEIRVEGKTDPVVVHGGRIDPAGNGYVTLASAGNGAVYEITKFNFDSLFPKGGDLFDIAGLEVDGALNRIELVQPDGQTILAKSDGEWTVLEPAAAIPLQNAAVTAMANALTNLRPDDFFDQAANTGLDDAPYRVSFTTDTGAAYTIQAGNEVSAHGARYARIEGDDRILAISRTDLDRIFRAPRDLFQLSLVDAAAFEFTHIAVRTDDRAFELHRGEDGWSLTINGEAADRAVDPDAAEDLTLALARLQADNIVFGKAALDGEPQTVITAQTDDGRSIVLLASAEDAGMHAVQVAGAEQVFTVTALDLLEVTPEPETLLFPAPAIDTGGEAEDEPAAEPIQIEVNLEETPTTGNADE